MLVDKRGVSREGAYHLTDRCGPEIVQIAILTHLADVANHRENMDHNGTSITSSNRQDDSDQMHTNLTEEAVQLFLER